MAQKLILAVFVIACMLQIEAGPLATLDKTIFETILNSLENRRERIHDNIESLSEKITVFAKVAEAALEERTAKYDNLRKNINKALNEDKFIDQECYKAFEDYRIAYNHVKENTNACVKKEIEDGLEHANKIFATADSVLEELNKLTEEARECRDAATGGFFHGLYGSITCGTKLVAKSAAVKARRVLPVLSELTQATFYLAKLKPKILYCASAEAYKNLGGIAKLSQLDNCL